MAEVARESTKVWTSKPRIAMFLSAMRHFAADLRREGLTVDYTRLGDEASAGGFDEALSAAVARHRPERLVVVEPGEWGVGAEIRRAAVRAGLHVEIRPDRHFLATTEEFARHASGRKSLRMEFFYREMRRRAAVLMDGERPEGGGWNYDARNRESFGRAGPGEVPEGVRFAPDAITRGVLRDIDRHFGSHSGSTSSFDWPVTRRQALEALDDFVQHRLPRFGTHQDAMWGGEPFLFHARLSAALNVKLLNPREVLVKVEQAYRSGHAPLPSAEGFIRQVLGWREYVRGVYWWAMPGYATRNELEADASLPKSYWTGETDMACVRECVGQTLEHGYAHHIQRLMVTGLFALLLGVEPRQVHEWYLAVYVDAVEWVELPNTLGMSQYADGGVMASKPYVATGRYIDRMSNYCGGCRFDPAKRVGDDACPFTTLYWDFLARHRRRLRGNRRMDLQLRNLDRLTRAERAAAARQAERVRAAHT